MKPEQIKSVIESILFVAEKPVNIKEIATVAGVMVSEIQKFLAQISEEYSKRGIKLINKGEYFSFVSDPDNALYVSKFLNDELRHDLSQAALEALAIITYRQPITKAEIEDIRGVNSDQIVRHLMIRGLIAEVGRKEAPGRPILYGTTMEFIQYFGLLNENKIPKIEELQLFNQETKNENS